MKSRWFHLKERAIKIRRRGVSIGQVEKKLGIPRSTLSGWFKNVHLSKKQVTFLQNKWKQSLVVARKKAVIWHNKEKEIRIKRAKEEALKTLGNIDFFEKNILELALAMLYMGEGFKKHSVTGIGNSDPLILKFFISVVKQIYNLTEKDFSCDLHLRADQNKEKMISFWSKELALSKDRFKSISFDSRTKGRPTYEHYKGVCVVRCSNVAIQRKLVYLSKEFCERVVKKGG
jgi:hypothetical protein